MNLRYWDHLNGLLMADLVKVFGCRHVAAERKDRHPQMTTRGVGPEELAEMRLSRRSKQ